MKNLTIVRKNATTDNKCMGFKKERYILGCRLREYGKLFDRFLIWLMMKH